MVTVSREPVKAGPVPEANGNHDLWVKLYNLSRVFKTDISAVLMVKSGLDTHRLEFSKKVAYGDNGNDGDNNGYTIPEGWIVMICPAAVHRNPTTYKDPIVFNPWRWKDISEPVGGSNDFLAFGWGLRFCVGADFSKLQITVFLHYLTTKYRHCTWPKMMNMVRWKVVSGGNMVLSPGLAFPKGCHIQITPKSILLAHKIYE
ncbi:hypothetical protein U9M48_000636 [Paspalum notatum var. saurae]|uniref:Cytochrome P450 n=1 Tax=Paspalum notatum var. saurae TaxID=547442 RepID=A0AAQ3SG30_PASNO